MMKQNDNKQIVFDMLEEIATESIAEVRNVYTYEEIDECYKEAKTIAEKAKTYLQETINKQYKQGVRLDVPKNRC